MSCSQIITVFLLSFLERVSCLKLAHCFGSGAPPIGNRQQRHNKDKESFPIIQHIDLFSHFVWCFSEYLLYRRQVLLIGLAFFTLELISDRLSYGEVVFE